MFDIALHEPQIAPNTGNIIRLTANIGCDLHLIKPLGFELEDKKLRRAGLDYHALAKVTVHASFDEFFDVLGNHRIIAYTTKGQRLYHQLEYKIGDILLFGSETTGLPSHILERISKDLHVRIPMRPESRSLNLSNAVSIASYEAWRQLGFTSSK